MHTISIPSSKADYDEMMRSIDNETNEFIRTQDFYQRGLLELYIKGYRDAVYKLFPLPYRAAAMQDMLADIRKTFPPAQPVVNKQDTAEEKA